MKLLLSAILLLSSTAAEAAAYRCVVTKVYGTEIADLLALKQGSKVNVAAEVAQIGEFKFATRHGHKIYFSQNPKAVEVIQADREVSFFLTIAAAGRSQLYGRFDAEDSSVLADLNCR